MMIAAQELVLDRSGDVLAAGGNGTAFEAPLHDSPPEHVLDLELLRQKINSEEYLNEAIQRLALILTNELLDISPGRTFYERQGR